VGVHPLRFVFTSGPFIYLSVSHKTPNFFSVYQLKIDNDSISEY
jgi:hypothetical protein